nr:hypothetical protein GCM10020241_17170 [Streptoalloteichus tenebrarius]
MVGGRPASPEDLPHAAAGDGAAEVHVDLQRGTQRRAGVVRGRVHEDVVEPGAPQQLPVEGAVLSDASGERQSAVTGDALPVADDVPGDGLQGLLESGREVLVRLGEGVPLPSGWETRAGERGVQVLVVEPEVPVGQEFVEPGEHRAVGGGVAVRGESHDLVLVAQPVAEQLRSREVEVAQGSADLVAGQQLHAVAMRAVDGDGGLLAGAVEHRDQCVVVAGLGIGGVRVGGVVRDEPNRVVREVHVEPLPDPIGQ